jgi:phytol kinase
MVYYRRSTLIGSALLGVIIVGYVSWALGSWPWLLPPLVLFLSYTLLSPRTPINSRRVHNIHAVVSVCSVGLIWLFLSRILDRPEYLYLFTLSFAAHLAIIGIARLSYDYPRLSGRSLLMICVVQAWLLLFIPYVLLTGFSVQTLVETIFALPAVALAATGFYVLQPDVRDCPTDTPRWVRQATLAGLGSLVGLVPLAFV